MKEYKGWGWPNRATWAIEAHNLIDYEELEIDKNLGYFGNVGKIAEAMKQQIHNWVGACQACIARDLARVLLEDVHWQALAEAYLGDWEEFMENRKSAVREAQNLDELLEALRGFDLPDLPIDVPTFGGEDPPNPLKVWSWDETRLLIGLCGKDLQIVSRAGFDFS